MKESKLREKLYTQLNLNYYDFNNSISTNDSIYEKSVQFEQANEIELKYEKSISYLDGSFDLNGCTIHRIYFSNYVDEALHSGKKELSPGEIAVTDRWINHKYGFLENDYSKYIGKEIDSYEITYKIVAVINTNNALISELDKAFMAYMPYESFVEDMPFTSIKIDVTKPDSDELTNQIISSDESLQNGYFKIGKKYKNELNLEVGKKYLIKYNPKVKNRVLSTQLNDCCFELIFDGYADYDSMYYLTNDDIKKIYMNEASIFFSIGYFGISVRGIDIDNLNEVRILGLYDDSYLEGILEDDIKKVEYISKILLLFSIPIIIISIYIVLTYANSVFERMKDSIKLLKIIGIKNRNIISVVFSNVLLLVR